ncbi:MAG: response regulator transcription factor [Planctomycetes bacterium]|nr:response regulator transcription factor [Planctomycetota bacterium]
MENNATVFVVDDEVEVRESLRWLIESIDLNVETFESAEEFLRAYNPDRPGCAVIDMRMPEVSGLELQKKLKAKGIALPLIFITGFGSVPIAVEALKMGAVDFMEKPFSDQALLDKIHHALEIDRQTRLKKSRNENVSARVKDLTSREKEIMDLVVQGKATKRIAVQLGISPKTVEAHRARVMQKMKADSIADLVRSAMSVKVH